MCAPHYVIIHVWSFEKQFRCDRDKCPFLENRFCDTIVFTKIEAGKGTQNDKTKAHHRHQHHCHQHQPSVVAVVVVVGTVVKSFVFFFAYHTCIAQWSQFSVLHPLKPVCGECALHWTMRAAAEATASPTNQHHIPYSLSVCVCGSNNCRKASECRNNGRRMTKR